MCARAARARGRRGADITDPFDVYDSSFERSARGFIEIGRERVRIRRLTMSLPYSFRSSGGRRDDEDRRSDR